MKFSVNERCIGCALCTGIAAETFEMSGDGVAVVKQQPEDGILTAKAMEALEGCPVDAIEKH